MMMIHHVMKKESWAVASAGFRRAEVGRRSIYRPEFTGLTGHRASIFPSRMRIMPNYHARLMLGWYKMLVEQDASLERF